MASWILGQASASGATAKAREGVRKALMALAATALALETVVEKVVETAIGLKHVLSNLFGLIVRPRLETMQCV